MTILFIFLIVATIVIDFLTYKNDEEVELKERKIKRITKNFISICLTYLVFTLVFSLVFRYLLVSEDYFTCNNICAIKITNTFAGVVALLLQIVNIYNFYDNYIYTYRYFTKYSKIYEKIIIAFLGLATILLNEFILSNIDLSILLFNTSIYNILLKLVIYSPYIFMILLIIIREIYRIIKSFNEEDYA